jgi:hypothetical protein
MQRCCNGGKIGDKTPIVGCQSQKHQSHPVAEGTVSLSLFYQDLVEFHAKRSRSQL